MPIGSIVGGRLVLVADGPLDRGDALCLPGFVAGVLHVVLFVFAAPKLTTERIEAARPAAE